MHGLVAALLSDATARDRTLEMQRVDIARIASAVATRAKAICDPAEVTARAFADQEQRIEELGGAAVVRQMGSYPYTPAPGEAPRMSP
jgi:hypothetical protein